MKGSRHLFPTSCEEPPCGASAQTNRSSGDPTSHVACLLCRRRAQKSVWFRDVEQLRLYVRRWQEAVRAAGREEDLFPLMLGDESIVSKVGKPSAPLSRGNPNVLAWFQERCCSQASG